MASPTGALTCTRCTLPTSEHADRPPSPVPVHISPPGSLPTATANNRYARLIPSQSIATVDSFTLESGVTLQNVPVGFRTWGKLNDRCAHSLSLRTHSLSLSHRLTRDGYTARTMSWSSVTP